MSSKVIIGAGFGDEGKGLFTDYLCRTCANPLVIRFSGGQQAGHTVAAGGIRHIFANFGAGTLAGAPSYFSRFCTIDPVGIVNELVALQAKGVEPILFIDAHCPVTTPYDIRRNQDHHPHGSCGVGVGDTINREEHHYSLTFGDLFFPWVLHTRLELIRSFYPKYENTCTKDFLTCCAALINTPCIRISHGLPPGEWSDYVYEGSQGLLLDQHHGFFPHVTRSNTGTTNAALLMDDDAPELYLVSRAYQTRHGDGPMSNEHLPHAIKLNPQETNIHNHFQGSFRRTLLDLDLLAYALSKDEMLRTSTNKSLVLTCLDHIQAEYRFTRQGRVVYCDGVEDFISQVARPLGFSQVYVSSSDDGRAIQHIEL